MDWAHNPMMKPHKRIINQALVPGNRNVGIPKITLKITVKGELMLYNKTQTELKELYTKKRMGEIGGRVNTVRERVLERQTDLLKN